MAKYAEAFVKIQEIDKVGFTQEAHKKSVHPKFEQYAKDYILHKKKKTMTYKELLDSTPFEEIEPCIINTYTNMYGMWRWRLHYDMLRSLTPEINPNADSSAFVIGMSESFQGRFYLPPMERISWESCLAKELKLLPEVTISWPDIAACMLFLSCLNGHTQYEAKEKAESLRFSKLSIGEKARMYASQIRGKGGYAPTIKSLNPIEKKKLIRQLRGVMRWTKECKMNRSKRKREFRQMFMSIYYKPIITISRFILETEPAWKDSSSSLSVKRICGLYDSLKCRIKVVPSYVRDDMGISAAKYIENLIRKYPLLERKDFNRVIIHLVTNVPHERLSEDEQALINYIIEGGEGEQPFESSDLLISSDPSLGKQIILRLAFYYSDKPL